MSTREIMKINLAPRPGWLKSVFAKHLSVEACFSELFDNAFDQDATVIEVTTSPDSVIVLDNGRGVADMEHMLAFSDVPADLRRRLGRFGVGGKYGAMNLGAQLEVETRHGIQRSRAFVDWEALQQQSENWDLLIEKPQASHGDPFTKLTISRLHHSNLRTRLERVTPNLGRTYRPALLNDKRIVIDGKDLSTPSLPKFLLKPRVINDHFNGKHFRLTFGIRADESPYRGYDVAYMYRVIAQNDCSGFGDYSPLHVYGWLELLNDAEDWGLAELKAGTFAERDELYDFLLPRIEDILQEAQKHCGNLALDNAAAVLNERLKLLQLCGPKRKPSTPPEHPRGPYQHHDPPEPTPRKPPRTLEERLANTGYKVYWDMEEPSKVGMVTYSGRHGKIHLNPTYALINDRGEAENSDAMLVICLTLIVMDWHDRNETDRPPIGELFNPDVEMISQLSKLLQEVTAKKAAMVGDEG